MLSLNDKPKSVTGQLEKPLREWLNICVAATRQLGIGRFGYLLAIWLLLRHIVSFEQVVILVLLAGALERTNQSDGQRRPLTFNRKRAPARCDTHH